MLWNVRSLSNNLKFYFVLQTLIDSDIHTACITETWLNNGHDHILALLDSYGFSISHSFRASRKGGGVAILVKKELKLKKLTRNLVFDSFEWHGIRYLSKRTVCVLCIYIKQEFSLILFLEELDKLLTSVCGNTSDHVLLTGDFNVHF